jgi:cytochrome c553
MKTRAISRSSTRWIIRSLMVLSAIAGAGLTWQAAAQNATQPTAPQTAGRVPDPRHGATIVQNGTDAGAPPCQTCHGPAGDGTGASPRLFGQSREYLMRQLHDFKSATVRPSDVMNPVATALSDDDIADVAAYYATRGEALPPVTRADTASLTRGRTLATVGDNAKVLPACNNCHGPGGAGEPPQLPALAGQFAPYITAQLQAWRDGKRTSGAIPMGTIAKRLDDRDIAAVAAYYQQIRDAAPATAAQQPGTPPQRR